MPLAQNDPPLLETSRKIYDIYSLGLTLLEIAHWKPLVALLGVEKYEPLSNNNKARLRSWLLDEDFPRFSSNPLRGLRDASWKTCLEVATRCIVGYGDKGLGIGEGADKDLKVAYKLQANFKKLVLEQLMNIRIKGWWRGGECSVAQ